MTARQWASVHRKHHAKCETPEDPHSPQQLGLLHVLLFGVFLYKKSAGDAEVVKRYGSGTPSDKLESFYENHTSLGLIIMGLMEILLFGPQKGLFIFGCQIIWIPFWAAGIINGVGHFIGYRNHNSPDASRNIFPIGIIIGGEELHNNHHAFPASAKLSSERWELDWGWQVLKFLSFFGLAKIKRLPPQIIRQPIALSAPEITTENLKAIVTCRFFAISEAREKLAPTILAAISKMNLPQKFSKKSFINWFFNDQRSMALPPETKNKYSAILEQSSLLQKIRKSVLDLFQTWSLPHFDTTELLAHFKNWVNTSENSGVDALRNLALSLKQYKLAPANL